MAEHKKSKRPEDSRAVRTAGEVLSNGSILELVRNSGGKLNLLIWNGKSGKMVPQFAQDDEIFVPLVVDPAILRSVQLPSHIAEYGSTRKLFAEISNLISRVACGDDGVAQPLTFFVFATWMADCLPVAPHLWIVAPPTASAAPLMQLLGLLCRRALVATDISSTGFHSLFADLQPTLLTEVFEPTHRVLNLLRASKRHGAFIASGGKPMDAFSAKILLAPKPLRNPASAGFPLEVVLPPTRDYVPQFTPSEAGRIAAEFQGKLLHYRLSNWAKVRPPAFDISQFAVPMREIAYNLAASIVDDDTLQSEIAPFLKPQDTEFRVDCTFQLPAIVLEALLARCHSTTGMSFPVGDLTGDVNTILSGRGDPLEVSPEEIGWALRNLGLHTDFMAGGRKCLILSNDVRKKIHDLAAAYGVRTLRNLSAKIDCPLCAVLAAEGKVEANSASTIPEIRAY